MKLERGTNKTEVRWNQVLPLGDTKFFTQRETEIAETAYQMGCLSPELTAISDEEIADVAIWCNNSYEVTKAVVEAQLAHDRSTIQEQKK